MARKNGYCTTGKSAANFAARNTERAIVGLGRYAATNRIGRGFISIPGLGIAESIAFFIVQFVAGIRGCIVAGGLMYLLIAFGVPLLIKLIF